MRSPDETMNSQDRQVRIYESSDDYRRDVELLAGQQWSVVRTEHIAPTVRRWRWGRKGRTRIIVTYLRPSERGDAEPWSGGGREIAET